MISMKWVPAGQSHCQYCLYPKCPRVQPRPYTCTLELTAVCRALCTVGHSSCGLGDRSVAMCLYKMHENQFIKDRTTLCVSHFENNRILRGMERSIMNGLVQ